MAPVHESSMISDLPLVSRYIDFHYYNPAGQVYVGLWCLWASATVFLALRVWCKLSRHHGLWYDDYILILSWLILMANDIIITVEYATGYSKGNWSEHMHILINTSSDGTVVGQTLTKTAFAVTLLRMTYASTRSRWPWQQAVLWFCIISMNGFMVTKCVFQWAKLCGRHDYQQSYRIQGWCLNYNFSQTYKEVGNIYNIIMDFIFAIFPWFITWPLNLKRTEKVGLCVTLSLGMIIAIITAVRTWWKDTPLMHQHDHWYIWRNAMSEIWYSGEVAGTIIVQCIPVLRPLLKDLHTTITSNRLTTSEATRTIGGTTWRGSTLIDHKKSFPSRTASILSKNEEKKSPGVFELMDIPEEPMATEQRQRRYGYYADAYYEPNSDSSVDLPVQGQRIQTTRTVIVTDKPLTSFPTLTCHCTSCKRRSGGIGSYAFVVPKQNVQFQPEFNTSSTISPAGGVHKVFVDNDTGSGEPMQRTMCAECGSPVCIIEASSPDARCLQFGLFADSEGVDLSECKPGLEMFASKRVKWMPEVGEEVKEEA